MITVISTPALNRVLLDANNTEISVQSTNGAGYYFRALIYVEDVFFDEQGWSRRDSFTAIKDLIKLYNAYFESVFEPFTTNGLTEQTNLKKKITITVEERLINTDALVESVTLPVFHLLYNCTPFYFDDTIKIQILGIDPYVLQIPKTGIMRIPFYANAINEAVTVVVKDNFGTILNYQTTASFTGKKIFQYQFDLSGVTLASNTIYFETILICGVTTKTMRYRLMSLPDFPVKELYFKNNFGYYIPAYFDGELEVSNGFKINDYQQADGTNVIFEINEEATYTINTGSLLLDERAIVNQIMKSHEVIFKVNYQWQKIKSTSKKELEFRDKKHLYAQDLTFSFMKNGKISNIGFAIPPTQGNIIVIGNELEEFAIEKTVFEDQFSGVAPIQKIRITNLPLLGILKVQLVSGLEIVALNAVYNWSAVVNFKFISASSFGSPYTSFEFMTTDGAIFSLPATATINIIEVAPYLEIKWTGTLTTEDRTGLDGNINISYTELFMFPSKTWQLNDGSGWVDNVLVVGPANSFTLNSGLNQFRVKAISTQLGTLYSNVLQYSNTSNPVLETFSFHYSGMWTAGDTIHQPEVNCWVDYYDELGVLNRKIIGPASKGCQRIIASSIFEESNVNPC
jgi:hypothetical protein